MTTAAPVSKYQPTRAHLRAAARRTPFSGPHCCFCHAACSGLSGERGEHSDSCPAVLAQAQKELEALEHGA
jgi:hypothetical protein